MLELTDDLFPLGEAPRYYPGPRPPHVATFVRWALKGVGKDRVRLETVKIGGRRYTSVAALTRFVARLTGAAEAKEVLSRRRTEAYRRAERELDQEGI